MSRLDELRAWATDKTRFKSPADYCDYARAFLEFADDGIQAEIVCQNEPNYRFWQYRSDGHYNVTRPMNSELLLGVDDTDQLGEGFQSLFRDPRSHADDTDARTLMYRGIYTIQQCIGATLDSLPAGSANKARKVNGDLFERLIRLLLRDAGIDCTAGVVNVPVIVDGVEQCRMSYQHDLILKNDGVLKGIGSVKTSSKDRIDKIFIDKHLFNTLTHQQIPHLAVFLNDVQRGKKTGRTYNVASTFLPGHFKGYTIALNPLDGVYYCDLRPNMASDGFLAGRIKTVDHLFCCDVWRMLASAEGITVDVDELVDLEPPQQR